MTATTATALPVLLPQHECWPYLGVSRSRWFRLRSAGLLPPPVDAGDGRPLWRRADLDAWAAALPAKGRRKPR